MPIEPGISRGRVRGGMAPLRVTHTSHRRAVDEMRLELRVVVMSVDTVELSAVADVGEELLEGGVHIASRDPAAYACSHWRSATYASTWACPTTTHARSGSSSL